MDRKAEAVCAEDEAIISDKQKEVVDYSKVTPQTQKRHYAALCSFAVFLRASQANGETTETLKEVLERSVQAGESPTVLKYLEPFENPRAHFAQQLRAALKAARTKIIGVHSNLEVPIEDTKTIEKAMNLVSEYSDWFRKQAKRTHDYVVVNLRQLSAFARSKEGDREKDKDRNKKLSLEAILFGEGDTANDPIVREFFAGSEHRLRRFFEIFDGVRRLQTTDAVEKGTWKQVKPGIWEGPNGEAMDLNFAEEDLKWLEEHADDSQ